MKITVEYKVDHYDGQEEYVLSVDGIERIEFSTPEPEDAYIFRDLSFMHDIPYLMKLAYTAGKDGEEFIIEEISDDE